MDLDNISPYKKENQVLNLAFSFALEIIDYTELLSEMRKFNMANQLFRSGTSIHANIREAQNAESLNDFIHKLKVAAKEAEETEGWLLLCTHSKHYPQPEKLLENVTLLLKMLNKIISSSKTKLANQLINKPAN